MTEGRRRARVEWVAIAIAGAFLVLAVIGLAYLAAHFSRYHSGWREAVPEVIQDVAWLPLLIAAWWIKIRVEDWVNGG
jgi:hypothetical protein